MPQGKGTYGSKKGRPPKKMMGGKKVKPMMYQDLVKKKYGGKV
jgi:hypothetical protein|tara:strand:- start:387 stop:515 length:129 start_codon:yes stop_codon:yes gene_type:complete